MGSATTFELMMRGHLPRLEAQAEHVQWGVGDLSAARCSGLPIQQYSATNLAEWLGPDCEFKAQRLQTYTMPSGGLRDFTHALFLHHA